MDKGLELFPRMYCFENVIDREMYEIELKKQRLELRQLEAEIAQTEAETAIELEKLEFASLRLTR